MIDLTTLEGQDTVGKVRALCAKAMPARPGRPDLPAGRRDLRLPRHGRHGQARPSAAPASTSRRSPRPSRPVASRLDIKLQDTRDAVAAGADEIDMVIDRGAFLSGDYQLVFDEIVAVKAARAGERAT